MSEKPEKQTRHRTMVFRSNGWSPELDRQDELKRQSRYKQQPDEWRKS